MQEISPAVWSISKELPLANPRTLQEIYEKSLARSSFALVMLGIAGAMAFALGVAGLYGVISYSVVQRTREIGIRVAIGAQHSPCGACSSRKARGSPPLASSAARPRLWD